MNLYHCPYCSPKHQVHIQGKDGVLVCGNCGDPLIREKLFKLNRVISIISVFIFAAPLLLMTAYIINNLDKKTPETSRYSIAMAIEYNKYFL